MESLYKYLRLIKEQPEFFVNSGKDGEIKIIDDARRIRKEQKKLQAELHAQGLPLEWARIGILLDDPYNILIRDLVKFPNGEMYGYIRSITAASLRGGHGAVELPEYQGGIHAKQLQAAWNEDYLLKVLSG